MMMKNLLAVLIGMIMLMTAACSANTAAPSEEKKEEEAVTEAATEVVVKEAKAAESSVTEVAVEATEEKMVVLDTMKVSVHKILNRSNVIVRFNLDLIGYTDTPNYVITDESGAEMELISANSAFWDLGGEVTNVFKLVFTEPLEPGKYNIRVQNIVDAVSDPHHDFVPAECELVITEDIPVSAE